ncbi:hypothetical protein BK637_10455 [Pseudomonas chlororaphis]|nr:hypothetical protein BK637_10455 [Pseudomonas chlororaphis]
MTIECHLIRDIEIYLIFFCLWKTRQIGNATCLIRVKVLYMITRNSKYDNLPFHLTLMLFIL